MPATIVETNSKKFNRVNMDPITLDTGLFDEVTEVVKKYKNRCNPAKILPASFWNKKWAEECADLDPNSIRISETTSDSKAAKTA